MWVSEQIGNWGAETLDNAPVIPLLTVAGPELGLLPIDALAAIFNPYLADCICSCTQLKGKTGRWTRMDMSCRLNYLLLLWQVSGKVNGNTTCTCNCSCTGDEKDSKASCPHREGAIDWKRLFHSLGSYELQCKTLWKKNIWRQYSELWMRLKRKYFFLF